MILAYIDPGTGSMLFSITTGLAIAALFMARSAWIRLKSLLAGGGRRAGPAKAEKAGIVIYSEGKRYWNVFRPVVEELERRGVRAAFYTSDEDDPVFSRREGSVEPRFIGKGNAAYARLNLLEAELCLMTTPGLDVYQLKRSRGVRHYAHILHAVDDATSYRLFGLDYFDSVLLTGEYQRKAIRELEGKRGLPAKELPVVGSTYLDVHAERLREAGSSAKGEAVLVAPSWGDNALLRRYGKALLGPLAESGLEVILRPHPQSSASEADTLATLREALAAYPNVEWDLEADNLDSLARAGSLISDFSGVVFDYAFLFGGPILYARQDFDPRPYDASDVEGRPWKFEIAETIGKELVPADFPRIAEILGSMAVDPGRASAIHAARDQAWQHRGESGSRVVDFIMERAGI